MRRLLVLGALCAAWLWPVSPAAAAVQAVRWCGTDTAQADRTPDSAAGRQVHVIYAFPAGGADRFAQDASLIATDIAALDEWWRRQDSARAPRFDLASFPGCDSTFGGLDLSRAQLPRDSSSYWPLEGRAQRLFADLTALGFSSPYKKYLVYYDGSVETTNVCGQSQVVPSDGAVFALLYLQACGLEAGWGGATVKTAVHELIHNLGAQAETGPPHPCPGDAGHPCDSESDILYPIDRGGPLDAAVLDVGRDDYYAHSGWWWDVQDSAWLRRLDSTFELAVSLNGSTGSGSVASDLPGIACPSACSAVWDAGAAVVLTAAPGDGSRFAGWSGSCSGEGICSLTMDAHRSVSALFALQVALSVSVEGAAGGAGTVTSAPAGINCPDACLTGFDKNTAVTLTATPGSDSRFAGWSGACSGTEACAVTVDAERTVGATFVGQAALAVAVDGSRGGTGRVTSDPAGIDCSESCTASFDRGSAVTLTAAPADGSRFAGWSGACSGTETCAVTVDAAQSVGAAFVLQAPVSVSLYGRGGRTGRVTSDPAGIVCPSICSAQFDVDADVTLTAIPGPGARLVRWGGGCSGRGPCTVLPAEAAAVSAVFGPAAFKLTASVAGKGTVRSAPAGIACTSRCSSSFAADQTVRLTATPAKGYRFAGWVGSCKGAGSCTLRIDSDKSVRATFRLSR